METTYTFTYRSVAIEVTATPEEEAEEALRSAMQAVDAVAEDSTFETSETGVQSTLQNGGKETSAWADTSSTEMADSQGTDDQSQVDGLVELARKVNIDVGVLRETIDVDPYREHLPFIDVDSEQLGDLKGERQYNIAHMILYVYDECYPESDRMYSSDLKDQIEASRVSANNLYNAYSYDQGDTNFDRQGRGSSATIALTRPGKREARSIIQEVLGDPEDNDSDG